MNFFKHHIGDYASATEHLTWDEDLAYTRLLRVYYRDEKPIPSDMSRACRLVRALTPEQREAVELVLREFFTLQDDGWHNKRADFELAAANTQAATNRRIAEHREAQKRSRTEHASLNGSYHESSTNRSPGYMGEREPIQTPDSRLQTPEREGGKTSATESLAAPVNPKVPRPPRSAARTRCPEGFEPDRVFALGEVPDLDVDREIAKFRDCEFPKAHSDWSAVWRNWIRRAKDRGEYARNAGAAAAKPSISNTDGTLNLQALKAAGML